MITRYGMVWPFYGWTMTISYRFLSPIYITIKTINYDKCNYIYIHNIYIVAIMDPLVIKHSYGIEAIVRLWYVFLTFSHWKFHLSRTSHWFHILYQPLPIGFPFSTFISICSHISHWIPIVYGLSQPLCWRVVTLSRPAGTLRSRGPRLPPRCGPRKAKGAAKPLVNNYILDPPLTRFF